MPADAAQLNRQFGIPGLAQVTPANGGLIAVQITAPQATGIIYLHGGHVAAWKPSGADEVLFLSARSNWQPDKPIRGGVPICFPWFGTGPKGDHLPQHGFARTREWTLESITRHGDGVTVTGILRSDADSHKHWPADFLLRHRVTFGTELAMHLELTNTGSTSLTAEEAQHTYFAVGDVRQVAIRGLDSAPYSDRADPTGIKTQQGDLAITTFIDRPFVNTTAPITLVDPVKKRRIIVTREGSRCALVWNPWSTNAPKLPDFGPGEWPGMLCIETCNFFDKAITLEPGQTHVMTTHLTVEPI